METRTVSDIIKNLDKIFSREEVSILPGGCTITMEPSDEENQESNPLEKHLCIRSSENQNFHIFDKEDIIPIQPEWEASFVLQIIATLIKKHCEYKIIEFSDNTFEISKRKQWIIMLEQALESQSSHDCVQMNIHSKLGGDTDTENKEDEIIHVLLKSLPEFKDIAYPGESIVSILTRDVPSMIINGTHEELEMMREINRTIQDAGIGTNKPTKYALASKYIRKAQSESKERAQHWKQIFNYCYKSGKFSSARVREVKEIEFNDDIELFAIGGMFWYDNDDYKERRGPKPLDN